MKTITNKEINYSLHNSENFKKELDCELFDVADKLSKLFIDYFKFIIENIKLRRSTFSKFIITRGLDTIVNVFNHILFYTKNIDATYFHCQKAFYFYVEFVGQISEDEKMFLQLSSKDATTYVYKKTIYEINNELRKLNEEISDYTKLKLGIINSYVDLYKTLLLHLINDDFNNSDYLNSLEDLYKRLNKLNDKSLIEKLNNLVDKFYYYVNDVNKFYGIVGLIIKKMVKTPEILDNKTNKFLSEDLLDKLNESPDKFILWFMN
jgi:hypothetical protein